MTGLAAGAASGVIAPLPVDLRAAQVVVSTGLR
jgi:hypothetical protein